MTNTKFERANERIPQNLDLDSWQLPLNFQFGVSTEIVRHENYRWLVAVDALHPSDNYESSHISPGFGFAF